MTSKVLLIQCHTFVHCASIRSFIITTKSCLSINSPVVTLPEQRPQKSILRETQERKAKPHSWGHGHTATNSKRGKKGEKNGMKEMALIKIH